MFTITAVRQLLGGRGIEERLPGFANPGREIDRNLVLRVSSTTCLKGVDPCWNANMVFVNTVAFSFQNSSVQLNLEL